MSNCSDVGFQRSSPRDARFTQFIADGPGVAGFSMKPNPEEDGDAFAASFDPFRRPRQTEICFTRWDDDGRELSLEALEDLGVEFGAADSLEAVEAYEDEEEISGLPTHLVARFDEKDDEDEDDEESAIAALDPKYLRKRPEGTVEVFRSPEAQAMVGRRQGGAPRFNTAAILRGAVEAAKLVSKTLVAEETRKAVEAKAAAIKPAPPKGNGNGRKPAMPPVGKFLKGTVVGSGPLGLLVEVEGGTEVRIAVDDEFGHGSKTEARRWLHGHTVGQKVRVRVKCVNGAIYGVLTYEKHPRPWQRRPQPQMEARSAN